MTLSSDEIASCMEAAYERLRFDDAAHLLGFKTEMTNPQWQQTVKDFEEFITQRNWCACSAASTCYVLSSLLLSPKLSTIALAGRRVSTTATSSSRLARGERRQQEAARAARALRLATAPRSSPTTASRLPSSSN